MPGPVCLSAEGGLRSPTKAGQSLLAQAPHWCSLRRELEVLPIVTSLGLHPTILQIPLPAPNVTSRQTRASLALPQDKFSAPTNLFHTSSPDYTIHCCPQQSSDHATAIFHLFRNPRTPIPRNLSQDGLRRGLHGVPEQGQRGPERGSGQAHQQRCVKGLQGSGQWSAGAQGDRRCDQGRRQVLRFGRG